jgi:hypothetical protein
MVIDGKIKGEYKIHYLHLPCQVYLFVSYFAISNSYEEEELRVGLHG